MKDRVMKLQFGYYVATSRKGPFEVAEQAVEAEKNGFDSFWFSDHLIDDNIDLVHGETWTSLAVAAVRTKRIRLGSGVSDTFRRQPSTLAQTVATVDHVSSGRVNLGLGAGEVMNLAPFGVDFDRPLERLRETIDVLKALWKATNRDPANYDGQVLKLRGAFVQILPVQKPHPPIYVGALGKKTRELAGELADGWMPWINSPESYRERLHDVARGAKKAGRDIGDIDLLAIIDVATSEDPERARRAALEPGKSALVLERSLLGEMGYNVDLPESTSIRTGIFNRETARLLKDAASRVPEEAVNQISAFGTADDCIAKLEQFIRAGARHIVVCNQGPDRDATLRALSTKIMPYLREEYSEK